LVAANVTRHGDDGSIPPNGDLSTHMTPNPGMVIRSNKRGATGLAPPWGSGCIHRPLFSPGRDDLIDMVRAGAQPCDGHLCEHAGWGCGRCSIGYAGAPCALRFAPETRGQGSDASPWLDR
jgi:hypothetical protein